MDGMKTVGGPLRSAQDATAFGARFGRGDEGRGSPILNEDGEEGRGGKGSWCFATVKGDVHDSGKNLGDIILSDQTATGL